jgi:spoIIIJ-associated protein
VTQRENAVAEPSGSAAEQDAGDPAAATANSSATADPGTPGGEPTSVTSAQSDPEAPAEAGASSRAGSEGAGRSDSVTSAQSGSEASADGLAAAAVGQDSGPAAGAQDAGLEADTAVGPADPDGRDDADLPDVADLEQEGEIAADYVEGLLDVADLDGDIDMDVEGDRALVSVVGATLDELVGPRGEVLEALQELTRLAVHRQTGVRTRVMLDVGGYRLRRRAELAETGREVAEEVKRTGQPKKLWAMNRFERKVVHDAIAAAGLQSESEGEEPDRKVVVLPAE